MLVALRAAVALNDQGKFDEAIAKYLDVLKESPDNVVALYELAYSYGEKKDYAKSLEAARRGTQYESDLRAMFYDLIGSSLDASGQPQQAIDAYNEGIRAVPDAGMLYHNMAITYLESLKNPEQARTTLEKGAMAEPTESALPLIRQYSGPKWRRHSTFENDFGESNVTAVRNTEICMVCAKPVGYLPGNAMEQDRRPSARHASHLDIDPPDSVAPACP